MFCFRPKTFLLTLIISIIHLQATSDLSASLTSSHVDTTSSVTFRPPTAASNGSSAENTTVSIAANATAAPTTAAVVINASLTTSSDATLRPDNTSAISSTSRSISSSSTSASSSSQSTSTSSSTPTPTSPSPPLSSSTKEGVTTELPDVVTSVANNSAVHTTVENKTIHFGYYNVTIIHPNWGRSMWVHSFYPQCRLLNALSYKRHRESVKLKLPFTFPFYGHPISNITITTGGFVYTGYDTHDFIALAQYIAPLMANMRTSYSSDSNVTFCQFDDNFRVMWNNVQLRSFSNSHFKYQVIVYKNGTIVFLYNMLPMRITQISDLFHPVTVGICDAYIDNTTTNKFTVYENIRKYHMIDLRNESVVSGNAIVFVPLPTCVQQKSCNACLALTTFDCFWCSELSLCTDGMDRYRMRASKVCRSSTILKESCVIAQNKNRMKQPDISRSSFLSLFMLILVSVLLSGIVWLLYAYYHPHSISGQFLIRYRPKGFYKRRGEAHYTAASIHM